MEKEEFEWRRTRVGKEERRFGGGREKIKEGAKKTRVNLDGERRNREESGWDRIRHEEVGRKNRKRGSEKDVYRSERGEEDGGREMIRKRLLHKESQRILQEDARDIANIGRRWKRECCCWILKNSLERGALCWMVRNGLLKVGCWIVK